MAVEQGSVFGYFNEVRNVMSLAKIELYFVDPFLNAEFAERYLPQVPKGVSVRLLGRKFMKALVPAVQMWREEAKASAEVRSAAGFHDRFIFVDRAACYQSSGSFSDGAKMASGTITRVTDAFDLLARLYEEKWMNGTRAG